MSFEALLILFCICWVLKAWDDDTRKRHRETIEAINNQNHKGY